MRTATYCLVSAYLLAHLWTFWRVRVTPFFALRCLCVAMSVRAIVTLGWMVTLTPLTHWDVVWGLVQPLELLAVGYLVMELVYFVSSCILPGELHNLLALLSVSAVIAVIAALHSPASASVADWWKSVPGYVYVWLATFVTLMVVCLRIVKPLRFSPLVSRHMNITAVYLWARVAGHIAYPMVRQGTSAYNVVTFASLTCISLCLLAWGILLPTAARRPQAL